MALFIYNTLEEFGPLMCTVTGVWSCWVTRWLGDFFEEKSDCMQFIRIQHMLVLLIPDVNNYKLCQIIKI